VRRVGRQAEAERAHLREGRAQGALRCTRRGVCVCACAHERLPARHTADAPGRRGGMRGGEARASAPGWKPPFSHLGVLGNEPQLVQPRQHLGHVLVSHGRRAAAVLAWARSVCCRALVRVQGTDALTSSRSWANLESLSRHGGRDPGPAWRRCWRASRYATAAERVGLGRGAEVLAGIAVCHGWPAYRAHGWPAYRVPVCPPLQRHGDLGQW
jgi:hypothetical protein